MKMKTDHPVACQLFALFILRHVVGVDSVDGFALGQHHSCVLVNGEVFCWGANDVGQLGVGLSTSAIIGDEDGELATSLTAVPLGLGKRAIELCAGLDHTCALLDDQTVKCWGFNQNGQLGQGDMDNRGNDILDMGDNLVAVVIGAGPPVSHISCGSQHVCVILHDGAVKCWGDGSDGRLGLGDVETRGDGPNEMGNLLPIVDLGTNVQADKFCAGGPGRKHTCIVTTISTMKCWGKGDFGQLGYGNADSRGIDNSDPRFAMGNDLPVVDLGLGLSIVECVSGDNANCAILESGQVKC